MKVVDMLLLALWRIVVVQAMRMVIVRVKIAMVAAKVLHTPQSLNCLANSSERIQCKMIKYLIN